MPQKNIVTKCLLIRHGKWASRESKTIDLRFNILWRGPPSLCKLQRNRLCNIFSVIEMSSEQQRQKQNIINVRCHEAT
jgi:hypothetical protein